MKKARSSESDPGDFEPLELEKFEETVLPAIEELDVGAALAEIEEHDKRETPLPPWYPCL